MKSRLKKGLIGLAAIATLAGCSRGNNPVSYEPLEINNLPAARQHITASINNPSLEDKVDNIIESFRERRAKPVLDGAAKKAATLYEPDDANPDFDSDHYVDLDDFFLFANNFNTKEGDDNWNPAYDLVPNGKVDLDDFFNFANNFGKVVNSPPVIEEIIFNKPSVNPGESLSATVLVRDKENDPVEAVWYHNGNEITGQNGTSITYVLQDHGTHSIGATVIDDFGSESNSLSKPVIVNEPEPTPVLSFPSQFVFPQLDDSTSVDLNQYSDLAIDDWSAEVLGVNLFGHNKGNSNYQHYWFGGYISKALDLREDDGILAINWIGNYNASDHGMRQVEITATKGTSSVKDTINVVIERNEELDFLYDDTYREIGLKVPVSDFYIWTGPMQSTQGEWITEEELKGNPTSQEFLDDVDILVESIPGSDRIDAVDPYFVDPEMNIVKTNDREEFLTARNNATSDNPLVFVYASEDVMFGSTMAKKDTDNYYKYIRIRIKPTRKPTDLSSVLSTLMHEYWAHANAKNHPYVDPNEMGAITIFSGHNQLEYPTELDIKAIKYLHEIARFNFN